MGGVLAWTLVIYIYAGPLADGDSVTVTATPMATEELCRAGGEALGSLVSNSTKVLRYECIRNQ